MLDEKEPEAKGSQVPEKKESAARTRRGAPPGISRKPQTRKAQAAAKAQKQHMRKLQKRDAGPAKTGKVIKKKKKKKNPNRLLFARARRRRGQVVLASTALALANRKLGRIWDIRHVVINKGGLLSKQGIRRDYAMGLCWSYSRGKELRLGDDSREPLEAYNRQKVLAGMSHANEPSKWAPDEEKTPQRQTRPRGQENENPNKRARFGPELPPTPHEEEFPSDPPIPEDGGRESAVAGFVAWRVSMSHYPYHLLRHLVCASRRPAGGVPTPRLRLDADSR